MARLTTRRRAWIGLAVVTGLAALAAGAWGLQRWAPFADDPAVTWPANVRPLAAFTERTTRTHFTEPVTIEFVGDADEYAARVSSPDAPEPTEADRADAAIDEAVGRALGLWQGDISLLTIRATFAGSAPFPATWLPDENAIVVNVVDAKSKLSPAIRAQLTLVLAQALDDQRYQTLQRARQAATAQDYQAAIAVSIGHAIWVHDRYLDDLSPEDLDAYYAEQGDSNERFAEEMADVPISYVALRSVAQQLGPMFIEALTEQDHQLLSHAFTDEAPVALDQVSLPAGKYLRRDPLEPVTAPPGPGAADVRYSNQMGPFALYLLLSTGLPSNVALTAADGWGNDRYTAYVLDDRVCVDVHLVADSRDDAQQLENGLNGWARARPATAGALVGRQGTDLYASACDPGAAADQPVPTKEAIARYVARAREIQQRTDSSGSPALAECVAVAAFARADLGDPESVDYPTGVDSIEQDCLHSV